MQAMHTARLPALDELDVTCEVALGVFTDSVTDMK